MAVLAGVSCILLHPTQPGCVLVGERLGAHAPHTFAFPGGKMDIGETPQQTCSRECMEEVGVAIAPERFAFKTFTNDYFETSQKHFITLFYECVLTHDEVHAVRNCEPDKCAGWFFAPLNNVPEPHFLCLQNFLQSQLHVPHLE